MGQPINHYHVKPDVSLTDHIWAKEVISPSLEGGLSAHKIWIPPHAKYPVHTHPSEHIIIIMEGGGYLKYWQGEDESYYPVNAGDVFYVARNLPHQVGADSRGSIMVAISVDSKSLDNPDRLRRV